MSKELRFIIQLCYVTMVRGGERPEGVDFIRTNDSKREDTVDEQTQGCTTRAG